MIGIKLTRNDFSSWLRNVERLGTSTGRRLVQRSMAIKFLEITDRNFGGGTGGDRPQKWPDLSDKYAKRVGRKKATLRESGKLFASIKLINDRDKFAEIGTDIPYAWAHQFGSPANHLPARPFFPVEFRGRLYRPTYDSDRQIWLEAKRRIQQITRGALLMMASAPWRRSGWEQHPLQSPIV